MPISNLNLSVVFVKLYSVVFEREKMIDKMSYEGLFLELLRNIGPYKILVQNVFIRPNVVWINVTTPFNRLIL